MIKFTAMANYQGRTCLITDGRVNEDGRKISIDGFGYWTDRQRVINASESPSGTKVGLPENATINTACQIQSPSFKNIEGALEYLTTNPTISIREGIESDNYVSVQLLNVQMAQLNICWRCGHNWNGRVNHPTHCPHCNSPYWDKPKRQK